MKTPKYFYFRVKPINKGTGMELEDASDVDVVEVVRCNDCIYADYIDDVKALWCSECGIGKTVAPDDFCSRAKMRKVAE